MFNNKNPFAMIEKNGVLTAYQGALHYVDRIEDIANIAKKFECDVIFVLPYCSIKERGFEAWGDEPILVLQIEKQFTLDLASLPEEEIYLNGDIVASLDDNAYADLILKFQKEAIDTGLCSQATISRKFSGQIKDFSVQKVLSLYKRLLRQPGHYMTVLFFQSNQCLIAGTPERHLEIVDNKTIMTPIAGTFRKNDHMSLEDFLQDPKEMNELFQVVDEEMKMMSVICPEGGTIQGPYLREIGSVIHTEYNLVGQRSMPALQALRHSLHAPTVTGSPLESAARQIKKFEPDSRRYYAGEIGIYKPLNDELDCAILLRGAEIFSDGAFCVQAGGGIVRDSIPLQETYESRAKANGILKAFIGEIDTEIQLTLEKREALEPLLKMRNQQLSAFWQMKKQHQYIDTKFNQTVTIINNEDDFAYMIAHMLRAMGSPKVQVIDTFHYRPELDQSTLVILGPGPGNPMDMLNPRMKLLQGIIGSLHLQGRAMMGICLGHQALAFYHGFDVPRQNETTQGMSRAVKINGKNRILGFYNSYSPIYSKNIPGINVDLDENNRIIAMYGKNFVSYQFHPESVMSIDGLDLLTEALKYY